MPTELNCVCQLVQHCHVNTTLLTNAEMKANMIKLIWIIGNVWVHSEVRLYWGWQSHTLGRWTRTAGTSMYCGLSRSQVCTDNRINSGLSSSWDLVFYHRLREKIGSNHGCILRVLTLHNDVFALRLYRCIISRALEVGTHS